MLTSEATASLFFSPPDIPWRGCVPIYTSPPLSSVPQLQKQLEVISLGSFPALYTQYNLYIEKSKHRWRKVNFDRLSEWVSEEVGIEESSPWLLPVIRWEHPWLSPAPAVQYIWKCSSFTLANDKQVNCRRASTPRNVSMSSMNIYVALDWMESIGMMNSDTLVSRVCTVRILSSMGISLSILTLACTQSTFTLVYSSSTVVWVACL